MAGDIFFIGHIEVEHVNLAQSVLTQDSNHHDNVGSEVLG